MTSMSLLPWSLMRSLAIARSRRPAGSLRRQASRPVGCRSGSRTRVSFIPAARHSFRAAPDPSLAHLGHLFVKPSYWGSGVATQLLGHAARAAAGRGFGVMRLFVPAGQARARRFYAREGFVAAGEPFEFGLGLPVLEYQRSLESLAGATAAPAASNSASVSSVTLPWPV